MGTWITVEGRAWDSVSHPSPKCREGQEEKILSRYVKPHNGKVKYGVLTRDHYYESF